MIILQNIKQINERINSIFCLSQPFSDDDFSFVENQFNENEILLYIKNSPMIKGKDKEIEELSLLIFQLKNYLPALCNLTNFFLLSKNFEAVYLFTSKLFISHVGNINYSSYGNYTFKERYFDRFIEIIKNCNISPENYFPFLLYIFRNGKEGGVYNWRGPCLEYMQIFYNENKELFMKFIETSEYKFELLFLLSRFNTQKALSLCFEYLSIKQPQTEIFEILKGIKKETLLFIDQALISASEEVLEKFYLVLLSFQDDNDAKSRILEIYKITQSRVLRNNIANKLGISDNFGTFKNEKQFLFAVRRNVKEEKQRVFSLAFENCNLKYKSGLEADFSSYTFLLDLFKNDKNLLNLHKLASLKEVFDSNSLQEFSQQLFEILKRKQDIKSTKWLVRFVSLLNENMNDIFEFIKNLFSQNRCKEAKYFIECLLASKKDVMNLYKELAENDNFIREKEYYVQILCDNLNYEPSKVYDFLVTETSDANLQKQRMFEEFISYRKFSQDYFQIYINLPVISKLCEKLVFGEYKFDRLYSAFVIENGKRKYLKFEPTKESYISVVHPQDIDDRFIEITQYFENPTFNQFEKVEFNAKTFDRSIAKVNSFSGMIVSLEKFIENLKKLGFVINKEKSDIYFNSTISCFVPLNLACEIQFEGKLMENSTYATISAVSFYKYSELINSNGKYLTQKQDALTISALPYRYFAYIMTKILKCAKSSI